MLPPPLPLRTKARESQNFYSWQVERGDEERRAEFFHHCRKGEPQAGCRTTAPAVSRRKAPLPPVITSPSPSSSSQTLTFRENIIFTGLERCPGTYNAYVNYQVASYPGELGLLPYFLTSRMGHNFLLVTLLLSILLFFRNA